MIRHRASGKAISLKNGSLRLREDTNPHCMYYWKCEQTWGWYGFRDTASGNLLGRDGVFGFRATQKLHMPWEWFMVSGHKNEGFHLRTPHWLSLRWVGIGADGKTLVDATSDDEAAVWEFVEV
ncbi:hypothetical protein F5B22DRAFT_59120 [Xylaria bambusicola]|uniref:uncharacterized protein n=1 Tax=Xylaria bambusicola TaxID=326684 RepID=UPI00200835A3|nr:uncharacterized protein F5B22DRAFT_59120 [Xylaria bambusicola]KAI0502732.1 hypothetical protein F5B22DRAFT_59120 [Xylaria bambusicola]